MDQGHDLTPPRPDAAARYAGRHDRFAAERDALTGLWNTLANARLLAFVVAAALLGWGIWDGSLPLVVAGVVAAVAFVALVVAHQRVGRRRRFASVMTTLNHEGLLRTRRDWETLPLRDRSRPAADHPYDADLDITGPASLLHLVETVETPIGAESLRAWLLAPSPIDDARRRQRAVAELAPRLDERQALARAGRMPGSFTDPAPFLAWATSPRWLDARPWLPWLGRALALAFVAAVVAHATGFTPLPLWLPVFVVNLAVASLLGGRAPVLLAQVRSQHGSLQRYADQLDEITGWRVESEALVDIKARLAASGRPAAASLRSLDRTLSWVIPPGSLAYVPLQGAFLWDIHVAWAVERWHRANGSHVRGWLDALGETEAIAALAGLADDNPSWAMPEIDPGATMIEAEALGHPLLPASVRVDNDVEVGPTGSFLLITGSNMSGKSTMLRAIGVNLVLANAGGPVCAACFRAPPVALWTSVRVTDSLAARVSFFMAELLRLKGVVDAAGRHRREPDGRAFVFLLDEILQGTNTAERRTAARRIIATLMRSGAIGAVTTHDLDLAETPALAGPARPVHFRETFADGLDGPEMRFDHLMRPGIATTTNALRLMEALGLALPDEAEAPAAAHEPDRQPVA